jgi:CheY-like chemotaxis protein
MPAIRTGTGLGTKRLAGLRILAAEDNALVREVLADALVAEGAEVVAADDGKHAVELFADSDPARFNLVLMDVEMPGIDGLQATRQILAVDPRVPVVGQTAHAHASDHAACRAAGMVHVITKPVDFDVLIETIRRHARRAPGDD